MSVLGQFVPQVVQTKCPVRRQVQEASVAHQPADWVWSPQNMKYFVKCVQYCICVLHVCCLSLLCTAIEYPRNCNDSWDPGGLSKFEYCACLSGWVCMPKKSRMRPWIWAFCSFSLDIPTLFSFSKSFEVLWKLIHVMSPERFWKMQYYLRRYFSCTIICWFQNVML